MISSNQSVQDQKSKLSPHSKSLLPSKDPSPFAGIPPPLEGYYSPSEPDPRKEPAFIGGRRLSEQLFAERKRDSLDDGGFRVPFHPQTKGPKPQYEPRTSPIRPPSYHQTSPRIPGSASPSVPPATNTSPDSSIRSPSYSASGGSMPESTRTHTQDLYFRSRSPKAHPPKPEEQSIPTTNYADPAYRLGAFPSVPVTPRLGDQERPWRITLPDDPPERSQAPLPAPPPPQKEQSPRRESHHREAHSQTPASFQPAAQSVSPGQLSPSLPDSRLPDARSLASPKASPGRPKFVMVDEEPTSAPQADGGHDSAADARSSALGLQNPRYRDEIVTNLNVEPIELPVCNDDSSDEIIMSSTAYPGQEWQPSGYSQWASY